MNFVLCTNQFQRRTRGEGIKKSENFADIINGSSLMLRGSQRPERERPERKRERGRETSMFPSCPCGPVQCPSPLPRPKYATRKKRPLKRCILSRIFTLVRKDAGIIIDAERLLTVSFSRKSRGGRGGLRGAAMVF